MLKVGDVATFKTWDGRHMMGKVIAKIGNVYHVMSMSMQHCAMFADGMYRFYDEDVVRQAK